MVLFKLTVRKLCNAVWACFMRETGYINLKMCRNACSSSGLWNSPQWHVTIVIVTMHRLQSPLFYCHLPVHNAIPGNTLNMRIHHWQRLQFSKRYTIMQCIIPEPNGVKDQKLSNEGKTKAYLTIKRLPAYNAQHHLVQWNIEIHLHL